MKVGKALVPHITRIPENSPSSVKTKHVPIVCSYSPICKNTNISIREPWAWPSDMCHMEIPRILVLLPTLKSLISTRKRRTMEKWTQRKGDFLIVFYRVFVSFCIMIRDLKNTTKQYHNCFLKIDDLLVPTE